METKGNRSSSEISALIKVKALELGYDLCGITHAGAFDELAKEVNRRNELFPDSWYAKGHADWLFEPLAYPGRAIEGAKSLVVCIRRYNKYVRPQNLDGRVGKTYVFDHRIPAAKTYHAPDEFEAFLKEALGGGVRRMLEVPGGAVVSARRSAFRAGLGRFGKNNFLYTKYGSWAWIELWITDVELQYDEPNTHPLCPPDCTKCIDACPTKALSAPYTLDYSKCIAYLSYHQCIQTLPSAVGPLSKLPPESLRPQMGGWLYGCDACQDACPMNRKWSEDEVFPELDEAASMMTLENIFRMDEGYFEQVIYPRFFYMGKDLMWVWKTNSLRAMANSGDPKYMECIEAACHDADENIRTMGLWARQRIKEVMENTRG